VHILLFSCCRKYYQQIISNICAFEIVCDVLQGLSYDHVELKIYVNGRPTDARFTGIRGTVFPVIYGMLI